MSKGKTYTEEFRRNAVSLMGRGRSVAQLSRELGVAPSSLYKWQRASQAEEGGKPSPSSGAGVEDIAQALKAARHEIEILKQEREILKKATAFFARQK